MGPDSFDPDDTATPAPQAGPVWYDDDPVSMREAARVSAWHAAFRTGRTHAEWVGWERRPPSAAVCRLVAFQLGLVTWWAPGEGAPWAT